MAGSHLPHAALWEHWLDDAASTIPIATAQYVLNCSEAAGGTPSSMQQAVTAAEAGYSISAGAGTAQQLPHPPSNQFMSSSLGLAEAKAARAADRGLQQAEAGSGSTPCSTHIEWHVAALMQHLFSVYLHAPPVASFPEDSLWGQVLLPDRVQVRVQAACPACSRCLLPWLVLTLWSQLEADSICVGPKQLQTAALLMPDCRIATFCTCTNT